MRNDKQIQSHTRTPDLSPSQLRAARSMLDWSRSDLAREARLSAETIKNIEHEIYSPKEETIKALVEVFARYGIQFVQYETVISVSGAGGQSGDRLLVSHSGIICVTASTLESGGKQHGEKSMRF